MKNMYDTCTVLFKKDNSAGWYYSVMSGSENDCKKKCKKLEKENNWYEYKIYHSGCSIFKPEYEFKETIPEGYSMHLTTNLIYMPEYNKWFYPEEIIPCPSNKKKRLTNNFIVKVIGEGDDEDHWIPENDDEFECGTDIRIDFGADNKSLETIAEDIKPEIEKFLERLRNTGYAHITNEEYTFAKILAWKVENDRIRIILHYYDLTPGVIVGMDKLISSGLFYSKMDELVDKINFNIKQHKERYEKFKREKMKHNA